MSIHVTYTRTEEDGYENLNFGEFRDLSAMRDWILDDDLFARFGSGKPCRLDPIEFTDYKGRRCRIKVIAEDGKTIFYTGTGSSHFVICTKEMAEFLESSFKQVEKNKDYLRKALAKAQGGEEK